MKSNKKVRQRESFNILLSNWDRVKELTEESANAAGTADQKYTAYLDSMEAATKRLQNAWEGFTQTLETSTVMKVLTNLTAGLIENFDKLKYLITLVGAFSASKIIDSIANPGEIGGFKGLLANIPIIGTGTKTNNLLENIDKNVDKMRKEQEKQAKANDKDKKTRASWLKKGFGMGDITLDDGTVIPGDEYQQYRETFKDDPEALAQLDKAKRKQRGKNAAIGAATTLIAGLFTDKNVDSGYSSKLAKLIAGVDSDITMKETSEGKAWRVGNSTVASAIMGWFLGPLGAQIGAFLGDEFASLTSTLYHLSDLERMQRVKDAKEQLKALESIRSVTEDGNEIMSEKFLDSSGYDKLNKYVENLTSELNKLDPTIIEKILQAVRTTGKTNATLISQLGENILNTDKEGREEIQKAINIVLAEEQYDKLLKSTESTTANLNMVSWFKPSNLEINNLYSSYKDVIDKYARVDYYYHTIETNPDRGAVIDVNDIAIMGESVTEKLENAQKLYAEMSSLADKAANPKFFSELQKYIGQLNELNELNKQFRDSQIQIAYLKSDISDLTQQELADLTMDGVVRKVVKSLEAMGVAVRDFSGNVKSEYLTQIKAMIKADSDMAILTKNDAKGIGELEAAWSDFVDIFGDSVNTYEEVRDSLSKGTFEKYLNEHNIQGDAEALEKLVYAANPERIEQFASAWNMTTEAAKELAKTMPNLTTAMGLMSTTEISEKMSKIATIFSDLSEDGSLTVENFNAILKNYPEYINQLGDYEALIGSLGKTLTDESLIAYKNALLTTLMGDEGYYKKFKEQLPKELSKLLTGTNAKTLTDVLNLAQTNDDFAALNGELEKFLNQTYELETDNPLRDLAIEVKEGLLDKQISNLNEQKDALSQINDERKKELEYIKAKIALEDAQKEKKRVYRAGIGWTYESDETAISEAKEKLDSLDVERQQEAIQLQIDSLEQQKEILEAIKNNEQLEEIEEALGKNGISTDVSDLAKWAKGMVFNPMTGQFQELSKAQEQARNEATDELKTAFDAYQEYVKKFDKEGFSSLTIAEQREKRGEIDRLYEAYTEAYTKANDLGADVSKFSEGGKVKKDELEDYTPSSMLVDKIGRSLIDWRNDDITITVAGRKYRVNTSDHADLIGYSQVDLTKANGEIPVKGSVLKYRGKFYVYGGKQWEVVTNEQDGDKFYKDMEELGYASGTLSAKGGPSLINEFGTEGIITPQGTLTALPSKTGVIPADITKNVWALGEVAPTLVASLKSLTQKPLSGNAGNTTYEEGQYIDNLTMNVYPTKDYDMDKLLREARAKANLTKHNN